MIFQTGKYKKNTKEKNLEAAFTNSWHNKWLVKTAQHKAEAIPPFPERLADPL